MVRERRDEQWALRDVVRLHQERREVLGTQTVPGELHAILLFDGPLANLERSARVMARLVPIARTTAAPVRDAGSVVALLTALIEVLVTNPDAVVVCAHSCAALDDDDDLVVTVRQACSRARQTDRVFIVRGRDDRGLDAGILMVAKATAVLQGFVSVMPRLVRMFLFEAALPEDERQTFGVESRRHFRELEFVRDVLPFLPTVGLRMCAEKAHRVAAASPVTAPKLGFSS
jgi:hypothetical protein